MASHRLEACYFVADQPARSRLARVLAPRPAVNVFEQMARLLEYSARRACPGWDVNVQRIDPAKLQSKLHKDSYLHNTQKMAHWRDAVCSSPDGARVLLIDSDTLVLEDLTPIWDKPFDVAMTTKPSRFPFNSGVVFVRVSDRTRAFVQEWYDENVRLLSDQRLHSKWNAKYGGINQAALGKMRDESVLKRLGVTTLDVPCREWNCEDSNWANYEPGRTRIVHYKSALRRRLMGDSTTTPAIERLVELWRAMDAERAQQAVMA